MRPYGRPAGTVPNKPTLPRQIDIPFDGSYPAAASFIQRIASEPRVPKPEGMQYISEAHSEMHYMLLNILLRPLFLPPRDTCESQTEQYLAAYRPLCTAPEGEAPWPAVARTADEPGPFERSWRAFHREQRDLAERARKKSFTSQEVPSL